MKHFARALITKNRAEILQRKKDEVFFFFHLKNLKELKYLFVKSLRGFFQLKIKKFRCKKLSLHPMSCIKLDILEKSFVPMKVVYRSSDVEQKSVQRFLSVDPLADQAPGWTPYRAFFNNPLRFIDPDGLFEIETGKIEKGDNLTTIAKQLNEKFKTNLTVDQIAKANNIKDVNKIKAGDFITLPGTDVELNFDLNSLKVSDANYNVDMPGLEWKGTSGREGYQNPESQNLKDKGPIPEGQYLVDPARTQSISDISSWDRFKGNFGGGTWPGLEKSWGEHRTWLTPSTTTNTFGRSGFTIHGGAVPGSAGCIDLTSRNNSFHSWLKSHNKPLILNVKY